MGSYCDLKVAGTSLYWSKNRINYNQLSLFSLQELNDYCEVDEDGEKRRKIILSTTVRKAIKRLKIQGYSSEDAQKYFNNEISRKKTITLKMTMKTQIIGIKTKKNIMVL